MSSKKKILTAAQTSGTPTVIPRGMRIEQASQYSALSPFYLEQCIRDGKLSAIGGPGSGVCAGYILLRETVDKFLDELNEAAEARAEKRRKERAT